MNFYFVHIRKKRKGEENVLILSQKVVHIQDKKGLRGERINGRFGI